MIFSRMAARSAALKGHFCSLFCNNSTIQT
jgi:hypothetical protein